MSADIRALNNVNVADNQSEQELLDYLLWSMKHDCDPHDLYDDPIAAFRAEVKASRSKSVA